jgi:hypothetical protein
LAGLSIEAIIQDQVSFEVDDVTPRPELMIPWGVYAPSLRPANKH